MLRQRKAYSQAAGLQKVQAALVAARLFAPIGIDKAHGESACLDGAANEKLVQCSKL